MKKPFHAVAILALLMSISPATAADASYKHWRNSMKAAQEARVKRDFDKMREILESESAEARQLGPASSAENSLWLAMAYFESQMTREALETVNGELQRVGDKPVATKLQAIRGILLEIRSLLQYEARSYDDALSSALEAKKVLEDVVGKYHPELYMVHTTIGRVYALRKDYPEAEKSMRSALRLAQSPDTAHYNAWSGPEEQHTFYVFYPSPDRVTWAATELGDILRQEGKLKEAEDAFKTGLKNAQSVYRKESVMYLRPLEGLASVHWQQGQRAEFEKDTDRIYDIVTKLPGLQPWVVEPLWAKFNYELNANDSAAAANTVKKIATVFEKQNFEFNGLAEEALHQSKVNQQIDWKRAEMIEDVLTKTAESYRPSEPFKAGVILAQIAEFDAANGKEEAAVARYEQVVQSQQNASDKSLLVGALTKLAERKVAANNKTDALPLYHRISAALQEKYGADTRVADAMDKEAGLMKDLGQDRAAKDLQEQAMEVRRKSLLK
jgi:hypothetical protein